MTLNRTDRLNYSYVLVEIQMAYVNNYGYLVDRTRKSSVVTCLKVSSVIYLNKMMETTNTFSQNGRQGYRPRHPPNTTEWSSAEIMWLHFDFWKTTRKKCSNIYFKPHYGMAPPFHFDSVTNHFWYTVLAPIRYIRIVTGTVKTVLSSCGTRHFIALFAGICHWLLSRIRQLQLLSSYCFCNSHLSFIPHV